MAFAPGTAMQWMPKFLPFGVTQDEGTHRLAVEGPVLQALQNGRAYKNGHIKKRPGWSQFTAFGINTIRMQVMDLGGKIHVIAPTSHTSTPPREFCAVNVALGGANRIDSAAGAGRSRSLPEAEVLGRETIWRDDGQQVGSPSGIPQPYSTAPDHAYDPDSDIEVIAWVSTRFVSGTQYYCIQGVAINGTTREPVSPVRIISTGLTADQCQQPRVVNQAGSLIVLYENAPNHTLHYVVFDCATQTWGADTILLADLDNTAGADVLGRWDACGFDGDNTHPWFLAYRCSVGPNLKLLRINGTTITATQTIVEHPLCVAVYANNAQSTVWVGWYTAADGIRVASRDSTIIATVTTAPTTVEAPTDKASQITITQNGSSEVVMVWTTIGAVTLAGANYGRPQTKFRTVDIGGALGTLTKRASFELVSKAWTGDNGGIYANVLYDAAMNEDYTKSQGSRSIGFSTAFTMQITCGTDAATGHNELSFRPCAMWAPGQAGFSRRYSTLSSMVRIGTEYRWLLASGFAGVERFGGITESAGVDECRLAIQPDNYVHQFYTTIGPHTVFGGAIPYLWDGQNLQEYGFLVPPENGRMSIVAAGVGHLSAGSYAVRLTFERRLANGDLVRSAPSVARGLGATNLTIVAAATNSLTVTMPDLSLTNKYNDQGTLFQDAMGVQIKAYRTEANGSLFYLEIERSSAAVPALGVVENQPFTLGANNSLNCDNTDAVVIKHEELYTTDSNSGGVLPNYPLPALAHLTTHRNRVFGISAEDRHQIVFTHTYDPGELPGWHPDLTLVLDDEATALVSIDDQLAILAKNRVYVLAGEGPDRKGVNSDFRLTPLVGPHGCIDAKSVVSLPVGIIYQAKAGLVMLDRKFGVTRIGGPVEDSLAIAPNVVCSVVWPEKEWAYWSIQNDARTAFAVLCYDWRHSVWSVDTVNTLSEGQVNLACLQSAALHDGQIYGTFDCPPHQTATEIYLHDGFADPNGSFVTTTIATAWVHLGNVQGFQRCRWIHLLGNKLGASNITVEIDTNNGDTTETRTWTDAETTALNNNQHLAHHVANQRSRAVRVILSDSDAGGGATAGHEWIGISFDIGVKSNAEKRPQIAMR